MADSAIKALATITLASSQATVTFSSISSAYRDLRLVISGTTSGGGNFYAKFNADSGSNYSYVAMGGDGTTASSSAGFSTSAPFQVYSGFYTRSGAFTADFLDYAATDKHKSILVRSGQVDFGTETIAIRWANTTAINNIAITANAVTFSAGSTFTLYGVSA